MYAGPSLAGMPCSIFEIPYTTKCRPEIQQFTIHRFHIDHRPCSPLKNKKNNNKKRSKTIVFAANFNFFRRGGGVQNKVHYGLCENDKIG